MATFDRNKIIYTADDEEPDCMSCDNFDLAVEECCGKCGPNHGWWLYKRTYSFKKEESTDE